jgi:hypothetical protein
MPGAPLARELLHQGDEPRAGGGEMDQVLAQTGSESLQAVSLQFSTN